LLRAQAKRDILLITAACHCYSLFQHKRVTGGSRSPQLVSAVERDHWMPRTTLATSRSLSDGDDLVDRRPAVLRGRCSKSTFVSRHHQASTETPSMVGNSCVRDWTSRRCDNAARCRHRTGRHSQRAPESQVYSAGGNAGLRDTLEWQSG